MQAGVVADQLRPLLRREEPALSGDGLQEVLGPEQGVILAKPVALGEDVALVPGVVLGDHRPGVVEVAAQAVLALGLEVAVDLALQQGASSQAVP